MRSNVVLISGLLLCAINFNCKKHQESQSAPQATTQNTVQNAKELTTQPSIGKLDVGAYKWYWKCNVNHATTKEAGPFQKSEEAEKSADAHDKAFHSGVHTATVYAQ
jgi:hypothetical protein